MLRPEPSGEPRPLLGRNGRIPLSVLGLGLVALALLLLAGRLWAAPAPYRSEGPVMNGELKIVGSYIAADPVRRWAAILQREHPDARVKVLLYGSGTAADAMAEGKADIAPLARTLKPDERALVIESGVTPRAVTVGAHRSAQLPREPLYLYVGGDAASPLAIEFVRVALSDEGQAALKGDYAPVPRALRRDAAASAGSTRAATTPWWGDLQGED